MTEAIGWAAVLVIVIAGTAMLLLKRNGRRSRHHNSAVNQLHTHSDEPLSSNPKRVRSAHESPTLLIVDDQAAIRMLLAEVFQNEGFTVHEAKNGKEAGEIYSRHSIDLVLLDLKMPDMDGIEALRRIKDMDKSAKAVLITAYGDAERLDEARKLGVMKFFTKPFDIEKLKQYVLNEINN